jgi:hypothetical protein
MSQPVKRRRDEDEDNELTMSSVHSSISDVSVDSSATEMTEDTSRRHNDDDELTKSSVDSSATEMTEDTSRRHDDDDELTKSSVDSLATEVSGDSSATETAGKKAIVNPFSDVRNSYIFFLEKNY